MTDYRQFIGHMVDANRIDSSSIIIDAGASLGKFSLFLREFTDAKIIGIECSRNNIEEIKSILPSLGNFTLVQAALSGERHRGEVKQFTEYPGLPGHGNVNNLYLEKCRMRQSFSYEVPIVTLGELINRFQISRISYLKMDIEGEEEWVLADMKKEAEMIEQVSFEVHKADRMAHYIGLLEEMNFKAKKVKRDEIFAENLAFL